jgi:hypothetical protein
MTQLTAEQQARREANLKEWNKELFETLGGIALVVVFAFAFSYGKASWEHWQHPVPTIGGERYVVLQTWTVKEHNYARNELTFVAHNTEHAPSEIGLTVRITVRCEDAGCPFYTGQVLLVTNALDTAADKSWQEGEAAGRMYFAQGEGSARLAYYFEVVKEVSEK